MLQRNVVLLLLLSGCALPNESDPSAQIAAVAAVLDDFHDAAAKADGSRYFGHLAPNAVFLGTDRGERWTREAFEAWAEPYFKGDSAWVFHPSQRTVYVGEGGKTAWFDETVTSAHYGACRGTGVLEKQDGVWKIAQYHLTLPVPNDLILKVVEMIREKASELEP